jgi:hypothetical protein
LLVSLDFEVRIRVCREGLRTSEKGRFGRNAPESRPIMLALKFVVSDSQ